MPLVGRTSPKLNVPYSREFATDHLCELIYCNHVVCDVGQSIVNQFTNIAFVDTLVAAAVRYLWSESLMSSPIVGYMAIKKH